MEQSIADYDGMIIRSKFKVDRAFLDKAKRLKFVGRCGAGMENIDLEAAREKGVKCFNSPEGNRDAVGEHALGILLSLMNKVVQADKEVRSGTWDRLRNRGTEIGGKTVGILGYGHMGSAFGQKLKGLSCEVIAYDKYKTGFSTRQVHEVELEEFFRKTDVLSIHMNLTEETVGMVDGDFFSKFEKDIYLINTARGPIVPLSELLAAIESGKVIGAALDVLEYEGLNFEELDSIPVLEELYKSEKVILTPHVAGWSHESNVKMASILAEKITTAFP